MTEFATFTGKNVDEAVNNALLQLQITSEKLEYEVVEKGSNAIEGISLTVAKVSKADFSVSVIPHTLEQTILKNKQVGDMVNLENDILGKYVQKLIDNSNETELSKELLCRYGF